MVSYLIQSRYWLHLSLALQVMIVGCAENTTINAVRNSGKIKGNLQQQVELEPKFEQLPVVVDPERRMERLDQKADGKLLDLTALVGMPEEYQTRVSAYLEAVMTAVNAKPLTRTHYYSMHTPERQDPSSGDPIFPDIADPVLDRDVVIPLTLYPRPESVNAWTESQTAQALGWRSISEGLPQKTSVYGSTVIFERGELSKEPYGLPASPLGTEIPVPIDYGPTQSANTPFFVVTGKLLRLPTFAHGRVPYDVADPLRIGVKKGATHLGELTTVPAYIENTRIRLVRTETKAATREFLAYALVDGSGAKRENFFLKYAGGLVSPYMRPLICERHQPRIEQHDLLLMPTPLEWPERVTDKEFTGTHEEWCFDDWFPAQPEACWVIREAKDSKPLQESFLLMPAEEASDRPIFFVAVFAETGPERLVKELSTLHMVSPDKILSSGEAMARLQELYEHVRTFDLSKK